jgi:fructuronate reductase
MKIDPLNNCTLENLNASVERPHYALSETSSAIVHFGAGNFHRAHQAVYCDTLLNKGASEWGITGVSLRSSTMRNNLASQDYLYTLAILGDETRYRVIGAIKNILVGPEDPQAVVEKVTQSHTQLVTTTITEKGYYLSDGVIDQSHPDIANDINSLAIPVTVYGFIAAALIKRAKDNAAPLTVLCCDNMHAGGQRLKDGVNLLLELHSEETLPWVAKNVAFSSSMVDRVTPSTDQTLIDVVAQDTGLHDNAPVSAEPFTQWIIEDNFAGKKPPFEQAGALFVSDITPFEKVKLRFLNAGHTMLSALGYLAGDRYIHEALQRQPLALFTEQALKRNVMPVTSVPESVNGEVYIDDVLQRFRNSRLPYGVLQVGTDSSQKIQQRLFPSVDDALSNSKEYPYLAFALAAWVCFVRKAVINEDLNDPLSHDFAQCIDEHVNNDVHNFLKLAGASKFNFFSDSEFMASVDDCFTNINNVGAEQAISEFLTL